MNQKLVVPVWSHAGLNDQNMRVGGQGFRAINMMEGGRIGNLWRPEPLPDVYDLIPQSLWLLVLSVMG